jgi:hypothetical protein
VELAAAIVDYYLTAAGVAAVVAADYANSVSNSTAFECACSAR